GRVLASGRAVATDLLMPVGRSSCQEPDAVMTDSPHRNGCTPVTDGAGCDAPLRGMAREDAVAARPVENLLIEMADALPSGGDLTQVALLLSSREQESGAVEQFQVRLAEARYRALVEQTPAVTFMAPLDGTTSALYVSPQIEELLGFSAREWLEDPFLWM